MLGNSPDQSQKLNDVIDSQIDHPIEAQAQTPGLEDADKAEDEVGELVSEEDRSLYETITRDAVTSGQENMLLEVVDKLISAGDRLETLKAVQDTLGSMVDQGGEYAKAAERTLGQIQAATLANESYQRVLLNDGIDQNTLFDELLKLTESDHGALVVSRLFKGFEERGQFEAMVEMINRLNFIRKQGGGRAEVALRSLDHIGAQVTQYPEFRQLVSQAEAQSVDQIEPLALDYSRLQSDYLAAHQLPNDSNDDDVVPLGDVSVETPEERAVRERRQNEANEHLEADLDKDLALAQAEVDRMVESGEYPDDWSFQQRAQAEKNYRDRHGEAAQNQKNYDEEAQRMAESDEKVRRITSNDDALKDFLDSAPSGS